MEAHPAAHRTGTRKVTPRFVLRRASDQRLAQLVHDGHSAAFEVLYERLTPGLLSYCRQLLGNHVDAEDAVQHALVAAHSKLESDPAVQLRPWLYTVARNRSISILRERREEPLDEAPEPSVAGLSEAVQRSEELREVLRDVARLPEDQRSALVLSELGDLSHRDIAEVVGCEEPKVKSLVFQARSTLMAARQAREVDCSTIRQQLATATGGALRRRELRDHLRTCPGCRDYRDEVRRQRAALAIVLPVIPTMALRDAVMGSVGAGTGIGGAAVLAGGAGAGAGSAIGAKAAAILAAGAVAGGIGMAVGASQEQTGRPDSVEAGRGGPPSGANGQAGAPGSQGDEDQEAGKGETGKNSKKNHARKNGRGHGGDAQGRGRGSGGSGTPAAPAAPVAPGPPEGVPPPDPGNGGASSGPSHGEIRSYEVSKGANGAEQSGNANAGGGNANAGGGNANAGRTSARSTGNANAGGGNANAGGGNASAGGDNPRSQRPDSPPGGGKPVDE
jgi:RNA polymerase sigma factor (sigma-70 family)